MDSIIKTIISIPAPIWAFAGIIAGQLCPPILNRKKNSAEVRKTDSEAMGNLTDIIVKQNGIIDQQHKQLFEQDEVIAQQKKYISERDSLIEQQRQQISEQNRQITAQDEVILAYKTEVAKLTDMVGEYQRNMKPATKPRPRAKARKEEK